MKNQYTRLVRTAFVVTGSVLLVGCSNFSQLKDPDRYEQVTGIDKHSSYPIMRRDYFERINLLELVDPEQNAKSDKGFKAAWDAAEASSAQARKSFSTNESNTSKPPTDLNEYGIKYDLALAYFRQRKDIDPQEKARRRNSIQERILATSMSRCNVFKTYLRREQADQNFFLGSLTTAAGVLGAVLPGVTASHNLAGAAGLFSGVRSEYNQAYFSNLAAHVIVRGIETKQELVYRRIQTEGQNKSIDDYPLEAAIKDAVYSDGLCSVVVGLDQAAASIDATNEPGMDAATRTLLRAGLMKEASNLTRNQLLDPKTLENIGLAGSRLGMSLVGSARGIPASDDTDIDMVAFTSKMIERLDATATAAADAIEAAVNKRYELVLAELKKSDADTDKAKVTKIETKALDVLKEGAISNEIKSVLKAGILTPMKLDVCYSKVAASAVEAKINAMRGLDNAKTAANKVTAQGEVIKADLAIQNARNNLSQKEQLVRLDIDAYLTERLSAIEAITKTNAEKLADIKVLAPEPENSASTRQECK